MILGCCSITVGKLAMTALHSRLLNYAPSWPDVSLRYGPRGSCALFFPHSRDHVMLSGLFDRDHDFCLGYKPEAGKS